MDRGVFSLPTARTDHLLPGYGVQSIHQSLTVLSSHRLNSPMLPCTTNQATDGRVLDLADEARRSEIRVRIFDGRTQITEGSMPRCRSGPRGNGRSSYTSEISARPHVAVDPTIPEDGGNRDRVVFDCETHGNPVLMVVEGRWAMRTTFRGNRRRAMVGPEMWAAVLSHLR
jgi:hypothetical protein